MLAYAANNRPAGRAGSPKALTLILVGHAAVLAAVLTAKMEGIGPFIPEPPLIVISIPNDPPPPPQPDPEPQTEPRTPSPPITIGLQSSSTFPKRRKVIRSIKGRLPIPGRLPEMV